MLNFDQISSLRWVRRPAAAEPAIVPLTYSGMLAPSVNWLNGIGGEEMVTFDGSDHPALAGRMAIEWGLDPSQVVLAPGTHWSILIALMERLSEAPGPVVVEEPTYEPLWRIPEALGVPVLRWPRPREREFALDPEALEGLVAQKPSVFLFSPPPPPGGAVLGDDDRALLTEFQQRTGALLISDEVYLEFEPDPASATLLGTCADMLIIRSFTKVMGLGQIRCSAIAGSRERIARLARAADYAHVLLPAPTRAVAERAWDHRE